MSILSGGQSDFFGLDIGTTAVRAVALKGAGANRSLSHYGQLAIPRSLALSDAAADRGKLVQAVSELVKQAGITSKNVAVNIPSTKVFTAVIDMNRMTPEETAKAIRYQADSLIPTPLDQSTIDWAILGESPKDSSKMEVLLTSVTNSFVEGRLDMLENGGFNVVGLEPDSLALIRAMVPPEATDAQMVLDIGSLSTDLVVALGVAPRLIRSIPTGMETIVRAATQNLNLDENQARQYIFKFGLSPNKLDGQIYNAIISTIEVLMSEIDKSIKFFQSRYTNTKLEKIVITGGASSLPELPLFIANKFGMGVEIGNAWRNVNFPAAAQNELLMASSHFAVASGLAQRST